MVYRPGGKLLKNLDDSLPSKEDSVVRRPQQSPVPRKPASSPPTRPVYATERPRKHGGPPRENKSLYTKWDSSTGTWVPRSFEELNGALAPKNPKSLKRGHDGTVVIEVGQRWMEKVKKLIVVVRGVYPSAHCLIYAPNRDPSKTQPIVKEADFRRNFMPYDLVPD